MYAIQGCQDPLGIYEHDVRRAVLGDVVVRRNRVRAPALRTLTVDGLPVV